MSVNKSRRKSRAPKLDLVALKEFRENLEAPEVLMMHQLLQHYDGLMKKGDIPNTFIALEAMSMLVNGLKAGMSPKHLSEIWPFEWDSRTVEVPVQLLFAIEAGWATYIVADGEKSLGQAFGMEGSLSTGRKALTKRNIARRQLRYANAVELEYISSGEDGKGKTLQTVYEEVADAFSRSEGKMIPVETVINAHKEFGAQARNQLKLKGIIK